MAKKKLDSFSKEELESITDVYDHFGGVIREAARRRQLVVNPDRKSVV